MTTPPSRARPSLSSRKGSTRLEGRRWSVCLAPARSRPESRRATATTAPSALRSGPSSQASSQRFFVRSGTCSPRSRTRWRGSFQRSPSPLPAGLSKKHCSHRSRQPSTRDLVNQAIRHREVRPRGRAEKSSSTIPHNCGTINATRRPLATLTVYRLPSGSQLARPAGALTVAGSRADLTLTSPFPLTSHSAGTDRHVKRLRRRLLRELPARAPVVPPCAYFAPELLSPTALRVDPAALMRPRRGQTSGGGAGGGWPLRQRNSPCRETSPRRRGQDR